MGRLRLDGWDTGITRMQNKVYDGVLATATQVRDAAVARAPVRRAFDPHRRPTRHDLADFSQKIRGSSFTGGDIQAAAGLLGIDLNASQAASLAAGRGSIKVQANTRTSLGPNNLSWRRTRTSRVTGRELREITPGRTISGRATRGGTFNAGRLRRQGVTLLGRARREARRGVGVIRVTVETRNEDGTTTISSHRQYGGYLRKHIVLLQPAELRERIVMTVRSEAPYSRYVEFPTSRTAAQPYLLPALKGARAKLAGNIRRVRG